MATELRPLGVRCNIACRYCYQQPTREQLSADADYDIDAMIETAVTIGAPLSVFGGEPLLLPLADLERLFAAGRDLLGGASIQTNGVLLSEKHIAMFAKYDVRVGISADGPDELNELRWAHSAAKTKASTDATMAAIRRLCGAQRAPGVIVTLHRSNSRTERLPRLLEWVRELEQLGVRRVRLHLLESESEGVRVAHALDATESTAALLAFLALEHQLVSLRFDVFDDIRSALDPRAEGAKTCVWNGCDPYTTTAVQGVEADGSRSNCGRTNKDGIEYLKSAVPSYERSIALFHTPHEYGGCHGCTFFLACKGQCPGTAIDGDWRNRTEHCATWYAVMEAVANEFVSAGVVPIAYDERRSELEHALLHEWTNGRNPRPSAVLSTINRSASDATA